MTGTPGDSQATIAFDAPVDTGTSPIERYEAKCVAGAESFIVSGGGSPIVVAELVNGVAYQCSVHAVNATGAGTESAAVSVTPALSGTAPGAPTNVSAHPGNLMVALRFAPPPDDGGQPITGYTATCTQQGSPEEGPVTTTGSGSGSPIQVFVTHNGVVASCTVHATNAIDDGPESSPPVTATPLASGRPETPNVQGTAGRGQLILTFDPPNDGGAPIFEYQADCYVSNDSENADNIGFAVLTFSGSPIVVDVPFDLPGFLPDDGLFASCFVIAFNANGGSPFVDNRVPVLVFPANVPAAPTAVSATPGNAQATVSFTPPTEDGGSPITGYTAKRQHHVQDEEQFFQSGASSPLVVSGLTNGEQYLCTVKATNTNGGGPESAPPVAVTPTTTPGATVPGAPTNVAATPRPR